MEIRVLDGIELDVKEEFGIWKGIVWVWSLSCLVMNGNDL